MENVVVKFQLDDTLPNYGKIIVSIRNTGAIVSGATNMLAHIGIVGPLGAINTIDGTPEFTGITAGNTGTYMRDIPTDDENNFIPGNYAFDVRITESVGPTTDDASSTATYTLCIEPVPPGAIEAVSNCVTATLSVIDKTAFGVWKVAQKLLIIQPPVIPPQVDTPPAIQTTGSAYLELTHSNVTYVFTITDNVYREKIDGDFTFHVNGVVKFSSSHEVVCDTYSCKWLPCLEKKLDAFRRKYNRGAVSVEDASEIGMINGYFSLFQFAHQCGNRALSDRANSVLTELLGCDCGCDDVATPTAITPISSPNVVFAAQPVCISANVDGETDAMALNLIFNVDIGDNLNAGSFSILGGSLGVDNILVSGNRVTLNCDSVFRVDQDYFVVYTPTIPFLESEQGVLVPSFTMPITVVAANIECILAEVDLGTPNVLLLSFNRDIDDAVPPILIEFSIKITLNPILSIVYSGNTVALTCQNNFVLANTYKIQYVPGTSLTSDQGLLVDQFVFPVTIS